jgi:hypothetical protein
MKNVPLPVKIVLLIALVFALMFLAAICSAEPLTSPVQSEVTKRDSRGRVEAMETRASDGTCMAQVVYDHGVPNIHVLVISRTRLENLGALQIVSETEAGISDTVLMEKFDKAIGEHCLPLIIDGYREA